MIISLLVAASENNVIGKNNQLLWHLPNDMKYFKNVSWAMPIIMGRKTYESLGSKPLNGRINIILTSKKELASTTGGLQIANNIKDAIAKAVATDCKEVFVIGGGEIFKEFFSQANRIYMTRVHAKLEGDTYFPEIDPKEWKMISSNPFHADEKHKYAYDFQVWERS
jgi:dihydrofolate reductase